jgi:hypothetical protein
MNKILTVFILSALIGLGSCMDDDQMPNGDITGYAPVYIAKTNAFATSVGGPQVLTEPGKLFLQGSYVFITDIGRGVHIVDNSNPSNPQKIKFISIPGVRDVAVKSSVMFADNLTDLVAFDISDINNVTLSHRIKDIYPLANQLYPDFATGYFECADTTKGYVIRWEKKILLDPKCYR